MSVIGDGTKLSGNMNVINSLEIYYRLADIYSQN